MISGDDYFGTWMDHPDATATCKSAAADMLQKVNALLEAAAADGVSQPINPNTHTRVSGQTLGGFRPHDAAQGAPNSQHKSGHAVDIYDPDDELDNWLDDDTLEEFDLYREHASATESWCHLQDMPPGSGRRTFTP